MGQMQPYQMPGNNLVRQAVEEAFASGRQLSHVQHAEEQRDRVYHRPNETVYETRTRTVDVYYFE